MPTLQTAVASDGRRSNRAVHNARAGAQSVRASRQAQSRAAINRKALDNVGTDIVLRRPDWRHAAQSAQYQDARQKNAAPEPARPPPVQHLDLKSVDIDYARAQSPNYARDHSRYCRGLEQPHTESPSLCMRHSSVLTKAYFHY